MMILNKIQEIFDGIKAEDSLKQNTKYFLQKERAKREKSLSRVYKYAAAFAVLIIIVSGAGGYSVLNKTVSFISIDINPSVELALNRFDNVVKASAYNDDGNKVLKNLDLKGKSYTEAIDDLLGSQEMALYFKENNRIDFTVVSDRQNEIIEGIQSCGGYAQHNGYCHGADGDLAAQAHKHGLSTGKYRAYMELSEYDENVTAEDCKNMTMKQIHDMIEEHSEYRGTQRAHHDYGMNRHNNGEGHHRRR